MRDSKKHDAPEGRVTALEAVMQSETERLTRMDKARGKRIVNPKWYWSVIRMSELSRVGNVWDTRS
jgi:hypothetical protein